MLDLIYLFFRNEITLVAPNVFHYGEHERVVVMCEGTGGEVEVYLEAYPDRAKQFSKSKRAVSAGGKFASILSV